MFGGQIGSSFSAVFTLKGLTGSFVKKFSHLDAHCVFLDIPNKRLHCSYTILEISFMCVCVWLFRLENWDVSLNAYFVRFTAILTSRTAYLRA